MFWIKLRSLARQGGDSLRGLEWWVRILWDDQDDVVLGMSLVVKGSVLWLIRICGGRDYRNLLRCRIGGDVADWICSQMDKELSCKWLHYAGLYCSLEEE